MSTSSAGLHVTTEGSDDNGSGSYRTELRFSQDPDDPAVAFIAWNIRRVPRYLPEAGRYEAYIDQMMVSRHARSQGLGTRFYRAWEQRLPDRVRYVTLNPHGGRESRAAKFWLKQGFSWRYEGLADPYGIEPEVYEMIKGVGDTPTPSPFTFARDARSMPRRPARGRARDPNATDDQVIERMAEARQLGPERAPRLFVFLDADPPEKPADAGWFRIQWFENGKWQKRDIKNRAWKPDVRWTDRADNEAVEIAYRLGRLVQRRETPRGSRGRDWIYDPRGLGITVSDARTLRTIGHFHAHPEANASARRYERKTGRAATVYPPGPHGRDERAPSSERFVFPTPNGADIFTYRLKAEGYRPKRPSENLVVVRAPQEATDAALAWASRYARDNGDDEPPPSGTRKRSKRPRRTFKYEGVTYHPYAFSFVTTDGRRRRKVLWIPGDPWVKDTFARWVREQDIHIRRGSNVRVKRLASESRDASRRDARPRRRKGWRGTITLTPEERAREEALRAEWVRRAKEYYARTGKVDPTYADYWSPTTR